MLHIFVAFQMYACNWRVIKHVFHIFPSLAHTSTFRSLSMCKSIQKFSAHFTLQSGFPIKNRDKNLAIYIKNECGSVIDLACTVLL